ncbi:IscS subfamily cysteine desulfurase [Candidatus Woesearchaeota archaeon]|nr:IscS subfamily cysteine desulfurase [Candidatus Woesearchaeota archaeon]
MKSEREIYLDNSATTQVDPRVKKAMDKYLIKEYGNPGSFNTVGLRAKNALESARHKIAEMLNAHKREIVFTGGGTESINLAIKGVARCNKSKGKHIIISKTEHHAVTETCNYLERYEEFEITRLNVDKYGRVLPETLEKAIRKDTILVSIMYANNEIGTINGIKSLVKVAHKHGVLFHTDACQAAGFLDINVKNLGVDLMTLNSSKIYGPKGVGLLYIKRATPIHPIIHGGGQEWKMRSGTENVSGIVGFAKALEICQEEQEQETKRLTELRDYLIRELLKIPKTVLNGHPTERLPNNINISFIDIEGEAILLYMNDQGICASSGSACTSTTLDPSHVITALGVPYEVAHGSVRFSLGRFTTKEGLDKLISILPGIVQRLRKISPINIDMKEIEAKINR